MNFRDLVFANIKKSFKKYLSYYLSGSFCIAIFFIFLSLIFNESVTESTTEYPLKLYLFVALAGVLIFSFFFVTYAHYTFIKNRYKEFGVYMISGMSSKDLNKTLFLEMVILFGLSITTGLIVGSIFANLIQLIVGNLLDIDVKVCLSWPCYLITIGTFLATYLSIFLVTLFKINKMDISLLMKENQKKESKGVRKRDYVFASCGLFCAVFSIVFMLLCASNNDINTKVWFIVPYITTTFLGIIGLANYGLKVLLAWLHKTKLFSKKMLAITQMEHKFGQNHRIILILSIMVTLVVLSVGAPTALVSLTDNIVTDAGADIEYIIMDDLNMDNDRLNSIIYSNDIEKIDSQYFIYGFINDAKKAIISNSQYNKWNNTNVLIKDNDCYNVITTWEPGNHGVEVGSQISINVGNVDYNFNVSSSAKGIIFGKGVGFSDSVICVSDGIYEELIQIYNVNNFTIYKYEYKANYKDLEKISTEIMNMFPKGYAYSRYTNYKSLIGGYKTFLFVALTQSLMFVISTGFVLFFKQMNELNDNKKEFNKLFKIGITDKEMTNVISSQLRIVYFVPFIIGTIFGFSIMYYMTNLFVISDDNSKFVAEFMKYSAIAAISYLVVQIIMYLYTKLMYKHSVLYKE